uniref:Eukaryotic translation initiation factor 2-alpha kinase 2 n=1 Tax=Oryzias sinensis TaxID=183150 RepID=A0A8C7Z670_9TELE
RAVVNGEGFPEGVGNNKKEAKKNAARNAWMALTGQSADSTKTENVEELSSSGLRSFLGVFKVSVCVVVVLRRCSFVVGDKEYPAAVGKTKKEAKEEAAKLVYEEVIGGESMDVSSDGQVELLIQDPKSSKMFLFYFKQQFVSSKFEGARSRKNIYWEIFCILKSISVNVIRFTSEYDCIEGLGRGKFGFVYKAKRKLEGTDCAVKIVRYKKEALREVKVLSELNHCNIVRYYICWIEDSAPQSSSDSPVKYLYIHMELCDTKTLRAWIDEKNMQDPKKSCKRREEGLAVALQIVNGVEHIHSKTLIHRDLKPANILFDRNGMVKIGDFGLVTAEIEDDAENQKERSGFKGTPSYMAPEQKRQTVYNNKVDIFAMGLIYFELLWNFPTFHERNEVIFRKHHFCWSGSFKTLIIYKYEHFPNKHEPYFVVITLHP